MTDDEFDMETIGDDFESEVAPAVASGAVRGVRPGDALDEFPVSIASVPLTPPPVVTTAVPPVAPLDALDEFPIAIAPIPPTPPEPLPADRFDDSEDQPTGPGPSRTPVWTVAAALLVGLACGFGGGYLLGARQRPLDHVQQSPATAATPLTPPVTTPPAAPNDTETVIDRSPRRPDADPDAARVQLEPNQVIAAGHLLVQSNPAGAQVSVDGRVVGRTPATIRGLAKGTHRLRLVRDGYLIEERPVDITGEPPAQSVTVTLERSRATTASAARNPAAEPLAVDATLVGALDVESRPPDAQLFLDGTLVGVTPFASESIGAGRHSIRLERDGYRRWIASVWVVRGERSRITASLER